MDGLTRWSLSLGAGVLAIAGLLAGYNAAASTAQNESFRSALTQLAEDRSSLNAAVEFSSYNRDDFYAFTELVREAGLEQSVDCGGYQFIGDVYHPAHVCSVDLTAPEALDLSDASADVVRGDFTLTVGEYRSRYKDVLAAADTVRVETAAGPQNVTYEGGNTFTLTFMEPAPFPIESEPWQFALAAVPPGAVWLATGGLAGLVTVLTSVLIRQRREEPVEAVGVEFFEENL